MSAHTAENHGNDHSKEVRRQRSRRKNLSVHMRKDDGGSRTVPAATDLHHTHNDHTYLNSSLPASSLDSEPASATRMILRKHRRNLDHLYVARGTVESFAEPTKKRKKNPVKRGTAKKSAAQKVSDRDGDHLYNAATTHLATDSKRLVNKCNNRYTDHLYNMRNSTTSSVLTSVADHTQNHQTDNNKLSSSSADKRVIDKDHMYQHNTQKAKNKNDYRGSIDKKAKIPAVMLPGKYKSPQNTSLLNIKQQKLLNKKTCKESKSNIKIDGFKRSSQDGLVKLYEILEDIPRDHDYSSSSAAVLKETGASDSGSLATAPTQENSPARSDSSDHFCDDSRRAGIFHYDHMYVHTDHTEDDLFGGTEPKSAAPRCFPGDSCRQEHSYANSEEMRYDACLNCSELVQQLIGTINQQKSCIEDLKKQLQAALARNKQLSLVVSSSPDAGSKRSGNVNTEMEVDKD